MGYSDLLKRLDSLEQEQETQEEEVHMLAKEMQPLGIDVHDFDVIDVPKSRKKVTLLCLILVKAHLSVNGQMIPMAGVLKDLVAVIENQLKQNNVFKS